MGFAVPVIRQNPNFFLRRKSSPRPLPSLNNQPISPSSHHVSFITKTRSFPSGSHSLCYPIAETLCATVLIDYQSRKQSPIPHPTNPRTLRTFSETKSSPQQHPTVRCLTVEVTDPAAAAAEATQTATIAVTAAAATAEAEVATAAAVVVAATEGKSSFCPTIHR